MHASAPKSGWKWPSEHAKQLSLFPGVENAGLWCPGWHWVQAAGVLAHSPLHDPSTSWLWHVPVEFGSSLHTHAVGVLLAANDHAPCPHWRHSPPSSYVPFAQGEHSSFPETFNGAAT